MTPPEAFLHFPREKLSCENPIYYYPKIPFLCLSSSPRLPRLVCLFVCLFCFVLFCFVLFCCVLFCFVCLFVLGSNKNNEEYNAFLRHESLRIAVLGIFECSKERVASEEAKVEQEDVPEATGMSLGFGIEDM